MKFDNNLMLMVEKDLKNGLIPMLLGEPGIGKSSWVMDLATRMHTKVFVLACNQLADKADLTGARLVPVTTKEIVNGTPVETQEYEQRFYPHVAISRAIKYAKEHPTETPILFMDEINRTTPDVTSAALSIPTLRSIGYTDLPDNLRVVTAGNNKGNIIALDTASISRFVMYPVQPDVDTFLNLDDNLNPFVRNVLTHHPETIFGKGLPASLRGVTVKHDDDDDENQTYNIDDILDDGEEMLQITTPRTITGVSNWLNSFTNDELRMLIGTSVQSQDGDSISALQEALEGHTGKTAFTSILLQEIVTGINTVNNQASVFTVPKPNCYNKLKTGSLQDTFALIQDMDDRDKSGCLVYALYEKEDNSDIISYIAKTTTTLEPEDTKNLAKLFSSSAITDTNKEAFFSAGTQLTNSWQTLFG